MKLIRNPDTGKTIAIGAIVGAVGYGIYSWLKGKGIVPPKEGEWSAANMELARRDFQVTITTPVTGDWRPANTILGDKDFSVTITAPTAGDWREANKILDTEPFSVVITAPIIGDWRPADTVLDRKDFSVAVKAPTTFSIGIANIPWWITGEKYWIAWITNPDWYGEWISSGWLDVNDKWIIDGAYASATILSVLLYNANYEELSRWENVSIVVQVGKTYMFDATEVKLKEV